MDPQQAIQQLPLSLLKDLTHKAQPYDPAAEFRLVGGCVRDALLGKAPKDYDVVTNASESTLQQMGLEPVGKAFPVYLYRDPQLGQIEIAVARMERKTGPGHKGFETAPTRDFTRDMQRRDLTINALSVDMNGELHGPAGALEHFEAKRFQHVSEQFKEDPLRVLRVARFAAQMPEWSVSPALAQTMTQVQPELETLPPDRIRNEMERSLMAQEPSRFFEVLKDTHCLTPWFSEVEGRWEAWVDRLQQLPRDWSPEQKLCSLCSVLVNPDRMLHLLGYSEKLVNSVRWIKKYQGDFALRELEPSQTVALVKSGNRCVLPFPEMLAAAFAPSGMASYLLKCQAAMDQVNMEGVNSREEAEARYIQALPRTASLLQKQASPMVVYHGTTFDGEPSVKGKPSGILWVTLDPQVAKNYAGRKGSPRVWEIELSPSAKLVDLRDLSDPFTQHIREQVNVGRRFTFGAVSPEQWPSYADFGLVEANPWLVTQAKAHGIYLLKVTDTSRWGAGEAVDSIAILSDKAILSTVQVEEKNVARLASLSLTASHGLPSTFDAWMRAQGGWDGLDNLWGPDWLSPYYYETAANDHGDEPDSDPLERVEEDARELALYDLHNSYSEWMYKYDHLQFPLTVYRAVTVPSGRSIKTEDAGVYWTDQISCAIPHWGDFGHPKVTLVGEIESSAVDWEGTLGANLDPSTGVDEQEIRLKPGAQVKIVRQTRKGPNWGDPEIEEEPAASLVTAADKGVTSDAIAKTVAAYVRSKLGLLRAKFTKPLGYKEVVKDLMSLGVSEELAALLSPVVNQRTDGSLNEPQFKRALTVALASPESIKDIKEMATEKPATSLVTAGDEPNPTHHIAKTLYHGTSVERAKSIEQQGLQPQVGDLVQQAYSDYADSVDYELEPLAFAGDKEALQRGVYSAMLHAIQAEGHDTSDEELAVRNWGALVVIKDGDEAMEHRPAEDGSYTEHPMQVETGDYYSRDHVPFDYILTGPTLVRYLKRHGVTLRRKSNKLLCPKASAPAKVCSVIQSLEFKAWFGKSVVVDDQGSPLQVYHGTNSTFDKFNRIDGGNMWGDGYYFTASPEDASNYATGFYNRLTPEGNAGPSVMPVYLRIVKPFYMDAPATPQMVRLLSRALGEQIDCDLRGLNNDYLRQYIWEQYTGDWEKTNEVLRKAGFDGLIGGSNTASTTGAKTYMVFSPNQIKSAIGNSGKFNLNDERLTASKHTKPFYVQQDLPPVEATQKELDSWVATQHFTRIGGGQEKEVYLTPNGDVFKIYSYSGGEGDATSLPIYIYGIVGKEYLPELYAYGASWTLEEHVTPVGSELLGMNRYAWVEAAQALSHCTSMKEVKDLAEENYFINKIVSNGNTRAIVRLFLENGLDLAELRLDNLGLRGSQIVVLDYSLES